MIHEDPNFDQLLNHWESTSVNDPEWNNITMNYYLQAAKYMVDTLEDDEPITFRSGSGLPLVILIEAQFN